MADQQIVSGQLIRCLHGALGDALSLDQVPMLLKRILSEGHWRAFTVPETGERITYDRFEDFAATAPLEGLGASVETIKRMVRDDAEALDLLDRAAQREPGRPEKSDIVRHFDDASQNAGNSEQYALRRLRKEAPELHKQVIDGGLSAHGAMVAAGLRKRSITIPDDPQAAARRLRRHFQGERLRELIAALEAE